MPKLTPEAGDRSDDELMQLAAAGSKAAYEALVRRHQRRVRAYCARFCGSAGAGDDVAQECFVEVWQRRASYEPRGKFSSFLFRIAANRCKNQQRKRRRDAERGTENPHESRATADDGLLVAERRRRVQHGLEKLPDAQREAIVLRYGAELDYGEIASLRGEPEATIRSRVFLGLAKLRKLLHLEKQP